MIVLDSDQRLIDAVVKFKNAAAELHSTLEFIDNDTDIGVYPFDRSFEEVLSAIDNWETSIINKYDK